MNYVPPRSSQLPEKPRAQTPNLDPAAAVPAARTPGSARRVASSTGTASADIPGFVLLGELGRGSQAAVYRARRIASDPPDHQEYALKLMTVPLQEAARATVDFRREAALLAGVDHPGLPRIHEIGEIPGHAYLVMDLVEGKALSEVLLDGPISASQVTAIALDLADPLSAVHRSGLLHRDVKPDNILVLDGRARLIDFGLATRGAGEREDVVAGTLLYSAPEQTGMIKRPVDQRSDLYSLGVVLYECLAGRPPFNSADVGELLRLHAAAPVPGLAVAAPGTPARLVAVITRLLAKDPDDRYPNGAALLAELRLIADQLHISPGEQYAAPVPQRALGGRDHERGVLQDRWSRARLGAGGMALIRGAAGSGKSHLAAEVARQAGGAGAIVLQGKASRDDSLPLAPFRAAVEGHLTTLAGLPGGDRRAGENLLRAVAESSGSLLAGLSPILAAFLGEERSTTTDHDRYVLAVASLFTDLAQRCGQLVLIMDDVQWLDDGSREVLAQLCRTLTDVPLLVLATARDDDDSRQAVADVADDCGFCLDTDLSLPPLDEGDIAQMISQMLAGHTVDLGLTRQLAFRSGGNPFVVGEYVRAIVDAGLVRPSWGHWVLDDEALDALDLPQDALGLVTARVQGLPESARRFLVTAAAVGTRFHHDVVAVVETMSPENALKVLELATAHHLVEVHPRGEFAFVHDRVREALLEDLAEDDRAALHARIASALARLPADDHLRSERVYAAAHHYLRSAGHSPAGAAFAACETAGRLATADLASAEAVTFLEHAASLGLPLDGSFLLALGTALARNGAHEPAAHRLDQALAVETDPMRRAGVYLAMADLNCSAWRVETARAAIEAGLAELGVRRYRNPVTRALSALGVLMLALLMQRTRIGLGSARGSRRERADLIARMHSVGAHIDSLAWQPAQVLIHSAHNLYHGNRLGSGPAFCRAQQAMGFVLGTVGLTRACDRAFARVAADPTGRDPTNLALTGQYRGAQRYLSGRDDGQEWAATLSAHGRLLDRATVGDIVYILLIDAVAEGRMADASAWYHRGTPWFGPRLEGSLGLREFGPAADALAGRLVDTQALIVRMRRNGLDDADGVPILRTQVWAALLVMDQQEDWGPDFDQAVVIFDALGLTPTHTMRFGRFGPYQVALGRLAQLRAAPEDALPARLRAARLAVRELRRYAKDEISGIRYAICRADLLIAEGRPAKAIRVLARIPPVPQQDAPRPALEIARVHARALLALGGTVQATRQSRVALAIAEDEGWSLKARAVRAEFGLDAAARTSSESHPSAYRYTAQSSHHGMTTIGSGLERTRLRALEQVSAAASRVLDPGELARICLDETIRILAADRAFLFLCEGEGEQTHLVPHLGRNAAGQDVPELTGYSASLIDRAWRTGEPLVITGTEEGAALGAQSVVLHGLRSILAAPLQIEGRAFGVVYVDSQVAKGIFSDDDAGILMALNNHVATSLETARAAQLEISVQAARQQRDLAGRLREAFELMSQTLVPDTVLLRLLDAALRVLPADHAWLLRPSAGTGEPGQRLDAGPGGNLIMTSIAAADLPAILESPHQGTRTTVPPGSIDAQPPRAEWVTLPLRSAQHDLGILVLTSGSDGTALEDALEVAQALVSQGMMAYRNAHLFTQVEALAVTDELTSVANRRRFFEVAERDVAAALRDGRPALALMVDIDHFKRVNDEYGHPTGDDVIRVVATRLAEAIHSTDILGRYGGEEFALLLPDADSDVDVPARLCTAISQIPIPTRSGPLPITVSIGVARLNGDPDLATLLARADQALYEAKETGRNRVVQI